jgi:hypothetical protein
MPVNICQNCGMPLNKEENKGTSKNGSKNEEYCKFCFLKGKFTHPERTMEEQIRKRIELSKKLWMPEDKARGIAYNTIPKLRGWAK